MGEVGNGVMEEAHGEDLNWSVAAICSLGYAGSSSGGGRMLSVVRCFCHVV